MNIIVFTQNVKMANFVELAKKIKKLEKTVFITTQFLFANEKEYLRSIFNDVEFYCFADFLTDQEMAWCDTSSFTEGMEYSDYEKKIKKKKNNIVAKKIANKFDAETKIVLSNDLGVDKDVWEYYGFKFIKSDLYHNDKSANRFISLFKKSKIIKDVYHKLKSLLKKENRVDEVYVSSYKNKKIIFIGKMNRIGYRLSLKFNESKEEKDKFNKGEYYTSNECIYMTTWHEHGKFKIPDESKYAVRWAQDGYLPPNYSDMDYNFKPNNVVYYCWDYLGTLIFKNKDLPYEMIPFRKKIYLENPTFPKEIKNILIVASGAGDWTAQKNRSDDDIMVEAFVEMAKRFPSINFTYRCHPSWVHPLIGGVNSINRVVEYFDWLKLPNLKISSNIPVSEEKKGFQLSYSRSSIEEDFKNADLVFGEHSISMIDAAFDKIPFASVNLTKRRNFFIGINDLGFPSCSTYAQIEEIIRNVSNIDFQDKYVKAVENYNKMTDLEI